MTDGPGRQQVSVSVTDELLRKATVLDPEDASLWFVWGNVEKRRGRYEKSMRHYDRVLELSPGDGAVLAAMGDTEKRNRNYAAADRLLSEALENKEKLQEDRKDDEALVKVREAYDHAWRAAQLQERDEKALKALRRASLEYSLLLLPRMGIQKTLPYLTRAVSESPKNYKDRRINGIACHFLAKSLLEAGEVEDARKWYETGIQCGAGLRGLRKNNEDLGRALTSTRERGTVKRVVSDRGFGFIEPRGKPGESVFFHCTELLGDTVKQNLDSLLGKEVQYTAVESVHRSDGNPEARWVSVLSQEEERDCDKQEA